MIREILILIETGWKQRKACSYLLSEMLIVRKKKRRENRRAVRVDKLAILNRLVKKVFTLRRRLFSFFFFSFSVSSFLKFIYLFLKFISLFLKFSYFFNIFIGV